MNIPSVYRPYTAGLFAGVGEELSKLYGSAIQVSYLGYIYLQLQLERGFTDTQVSLYCEFKE